MTTAAERIAILNAALIAAKAAVTEAGQAYLIAADNMQKAGCSPESIQAARKARRALSAAKGKETAAANALWFAEREARAAQA